MKDKFAFLEKNVQRGLFFVVCMMFFVTLEAQISYTYDKSGNRTARIITKSMPVDTAYRFVSDSTLNTSDDDPFAKKDAFKVRVYPNPTTGIFEIEVEQLTEKQKTQLYIYTNAGRLVKTVNRLQNRQSIDLSNQPTGIYLLRITVDDKVVTNKIIKQ
jgi:hypothetical protein